MLLRVHMVLIGSAIALAVLFALRAFVLFSRGGAKTDLVLALAALGIAASLGMYLRAVRAKVDAGGR
jgi:hypothetical protein